MSKKHDAIFDAVLSGINSEQPSLTKDRSSGRFLKRGNAIGEKLSNDLDEKTLFRVDPARCKMWDRHNRNYELLNADNCSDLIEGIQQQGRQEFPAVVRKIHGDENFDYEVICGARRHFAISWLRQNNYPQYKYLIEVRDLSDEEAFRLADIENRDRADISDYERACDYAAAVKLYYDGKQKNMAKRLQVSEAWLSRYLYLAKLPIEIVNAYPNSNDIKELHARTLKPFLSNSEMRERVIAKSIWLRQARESAGEHSTGPWSDSTYVLKSLKTAGLGQVAEAKAKPKKKVFKIENSEHQITCADSGDKIVITLDADLSNDHLKHLFDLFLSERK